MNEHIVEQIADYLDGRLGAEGVRGIEAHLASCAECAGDVRWAREFRDAAIAQGLRHLTSDRIVEIGDRRGEPPTEIEERHIQSCGVCERELSWSRSTAGREATALAEAGRTDEEGARAQPRSETDASRTTTRWRWSLGWGVAAVAAAAAAFLLLTLPSKRGGELSSLAVIAPLPVRITRGPVEPGTFEESRMRGLESYEARDYAQARDALRRAAELKPRDSEVALYLGSAELLLGSPREAAEILRRMTADTEPATIRNEALWQLANAELAQGRAQEAATILRKIADSGGRHRDDAAELLARIARLAAAPH